ncbi:hypothetical protein G7043_21180 [Lentzea sp. NEAU-D13]|uniref:Uncharacterized protein n=1 Tax=Lentzea alba TaxID=2714351 RepID=A0A7C9RV42_9PSEU|nr:hypothetical protein [Lentzea alba]NGY61442.1 hypothetical protein [Lentzea alba]
MLVYFGSLLATIALINTPVPKIVVSAVLNPEAGDAVARSLGSITKDLVLVLLISIYFEWVRTKEQGELLRDIDRKLDVMRDDTRPAPAVRKLVLDATSADELITTALNRHIPRTADKSTFVSLLLSTRPAHHDVSMTLRVDKVADGRVYHSSRYELTMPRGPLLVAVTSSPTHTTALSDACPELFDVATLTTATSFDEAVKAFGEKLECYVEPRSGVTKRVEFRRVATNSVRKYISPPVGMTASDLVLFLADLSREDDEFVRVRHHLRWSQDIAEHFSWWYADRPMFVRTLTMDMRELVRNQGLKVFVQVFLGSVENLMLDAEDGYLSLRLDRWVVQGQGAVVVW